MKKFYLLFSLLFISLCASFGQVAEISTTAGYQQNFDGMGSAGIATLPVGWKIEKMVGDQMQRVVGTYATATGVTMYKGGANMSATAKNGTYNFGAGDSISATDRALGGSTTGAVTSTQGVNFYLRLKNTGTVDISSLNVSYDIEKYRSGNNAAGFCIQLYTSTDGTTWTSAGTNFYSFFTADAATAGAAVVPIQSVTVSKTLAIGLSANAEIYLAWNYSVASGNGANSSMGAQQLALDNVAIVGNVSSTTKIDEISQKNLKLNCQNGLVTVLDTKPTSMSVYDIHGSKLANKKNTSTIDVSKFSQGVYFVEVINENNVKQLTKFIKTN